MNTEEETQIIFTPVRDSVQWFAQIMESKLQENDDKGGWDGCDLQYLSMRLTQERKELASAIKSGDKEKIIKECADVANFCMMIADNFNNDQY